MIILLLLTSTSHKGQREEGAIHHFQISWKTKYGVAVPLLVDAVY
jgi:hypothetical protein